MPHNKRATLHTLSRKIRHLCGIFLVLIFASSCTSSSSSEEDVSSPFTMTTEFLGQESVLTVIQNSVDSTAFEFSNRVQDQGNQEWFFRRSEDGFYRIVNRDLGEDFSLDVVNDGVFDTLTMAPSSDASGQIWQITLLDNGFCRLTNSFLGAEIALDVVSDSEEPDLTLRPIGDFSGQHWRIAQQGTSPDFFEGCSGNALSL